MVNIFHKFHLANLVCLSGYARTVKQIIQCPMLAFLCAQALILDETNGVTIATVIAVVHIHVARIEVEVPRFV